MKNQRQQILAALTILFYIFVIAAIAVYFATSEREWFYYLGFAAIGTRLITYIFRFML